MVRQYDNDRQQPLRDYVNRELEGTGDISVTDYTARSISAFCKAMLAVMENDNQYACDVFNNHERGNLAEIPACDYIIETWATFRLLASNLDEGPSVMEPLAAAMLQHMYVQYFG